MRKDVFLRLRVLIFCAAFFLWLSCVYSYAQEAENPFQISSDSFEYDGETGIFHAEGHVIAEYKDMKIYCDVFDGNTKENTYTATGSVEVHQKEQVIRGNNLTFNLNDNTAHIENAETKIGKMILTGRTLDASEKQTTVSNGVFTTCDLPLSKSHYHLEAKKIIVTGNEKIKAKGVRVYFKKTRILVLPFLVIHIGKKKAGRESAFSYRFGYDRKDKFFAGSALRFRAAGGVDTKVSLYYPVTKGKIFPFVEEIYENGHGEISAGYGTKRMKDIRNDLLTVRLKPQVLASFGPYETKKIPVTVNLMGSYENIEEKKDGTPWLVKGRKAKLFASAEHAPVSLMKNLDLSLYASYEKSFYRGTGNRGVFSGDVKLAEKFSDNFSSSLEYIRRQISGATPFLFDEVDLVKELKSVTRLRLTKTLSLGTEIRYNVDAKKIFETEFSVTNVFHCLEGTLSYNTRKKQISGGLSIAEF